MRTHASKRISFVRRIGRTPAAGRNCAVTTGVLRVLPRAFVHHLSSNGDWPMPGRLPSWSIMDVAEEPIHPFPSRIIEIAEPLVHRAPWRPAESSGTQPTLGGRSV